MAIKIIIYALAFVLGIAFFWFIAQIAFLGLMEFFRRRITRTEEDNEKLNKENKNNQNNQNNQQEGTN